MAKMINKDLLIPIIISLLILQLIMPSNSITATHLMTGATQSNEIIEMIQQINSTKLFSYVETLTSFGVRYTGTDNCSKAGDWIYETFEQMGVTVQFHHWEYAGLKSRNVVATIPGMDSSSDIEYLMTAHYDTTYGSIGANDDGSGVAALLAIAEVLSQYSFPHTIRFIAFTAEEIGTYGSFCYARDAYRNQDNIRAVINPDIIGDAYTEEGGKYLRFFYPTRSKWIAEYAENISQIYSDTIDLTVEILPNYIGADHQAFVDYGYDGVWIAQHDPSPYAHTLDDNCQNMNVSYFTKATKLLLAVIAELANEPVDLQIHIKTPYEGYAYLGSSPFIAMDLGKQWYSQWRGMTMIIGATMASVEVTTDQQIESVIFCIDGNFITWDSTPPYEWRIEGKHFPLIGRHTLQTYVYTTTGNIAVDSMDVFILSINCQYNNW